MSARVIVPFSPVSPILDVPIEHNGKTYTQMPYVLVMYDEDTGAEYWDEMLCRKHGRCTPCRPCLHADVTYVTSYWPVRLPPGDVVG